jgi:hypothetical protein
MFFVSYFEISTCLAHIYLISSWNAKQKGPSTFTLETRGSEVRFLTPVRGWRRCLTVLMTGVARMGFFLCNSCKAVKVYLCWDFNTLQASWRDVSVGLLPDLAEVGTSDLDDVAPWVGMSVQVAKANGPEDGEFVELAAGRGDRPRGWCLGSLGWISAEVCSPSGWILRAELSLLSWVTSSFSFNYNYYYFFF